MKLQAGDVIQVFGFVMLRHLDDGKFYRVVRVSQYYGHDTYVFAKGRRGRRSFWQHDASSVDAWIRPADHADLNKIVVQQ